MSSTSSSVLTLSSFNLLFFTQVLTVLTTTIKYNEYVTDKGKNISIPCIADGNIVWVKENGNNNNNSTIIQTGKFLLFTNVTTVDSGIYVCFASVPLTTTTTTTIGRGTATATARARATEATATISTTISRNNYTQNALNHANARLDEQKPMATLTPASTLSSSSSAASSSFASSSSAVAVIETNTYHKNVSYAVLTTSSLPHDVARLSNGSDVSSSSTTSINIRTTIAATPTTPTTIPNLLEQQYEYEHEKVEAQQRLHEKNGHQQDYEELEYQAIQKINLSVRTPPGPVTQLYFKASTILGFLIWRFNKTQSGGYPVRSFTAEYRNISYREEPYNSSYEHDWSRMDPINIAPNVRQMEVYHLAPNTTYEFRIWANNQLGSGEIVTTNVTTLPETKEEDLIRLIQPDLDNFDPRIWIIAVSIVLGTLVILAVGLCIVLSKECYQSSQMELEDGWDSIELIPNIILNPGFSDSDGPDAPPRFTRTIIFGDDDDDDEDDEEDHEPTMEKFKRKVSVFFTGPTIKRI